jgi:3-phenylpropionate/trans-cinnamate dioxygenase ferredoxin reductase subunit
MNGQAVIVGGGQAAHCAALAMRQSGYAGRIVLVGEEPIRPYERPPLSKAVLVEAEPAMPFFSPEARYAEASVDLRLGVRVEAIESADGRLRLADGTSLAYDSLLIATGGRARRLAIPGGEHVRYLRTRADAEVIRGELAGARRVVCIGAGVIGLEVAASVRALGAEVTVVEAGATMMGRCIAAGEAEFMRALHEAKGVAIRFGAEVRRVDVSGGEKRVILAGGEALPADCIVAGVGMVRNVGLAAEAGILVDNGIVVDDGGRTSLPGVYAAGDVTAFFHPLFGRCMRLESFYHAQGQGTVVGRVMAGVEARYEDIPRFWTDQHGVNLQVAGSPADAEHTVLRGSHDDARFTAIHIGEDGRVVGVTAANSARDMRPALEMIRSGLRPDVATLADMAVPLNKIAA